MHTSQNNYDFAAEISMETNFHFHFLKPYSIENIYADSSKNMNSESE